jgi:hypothetical protein
MKKFDIMKRKFKIKNMALFNHQYISTIVLQIGQCIIQVFYNLQFFLGHWFFSLWMLKINLFLFGDIIVLIGKKKRHSLKKQWKHMPMLWLMNFKTQFYNPIWYLGWKKKNILSKLLTFKAWIGLMVFFWQ